MNERQDQDHRGQLPLVLETLADDDLRTLRDAFPLPLGGDAHEPKYDFHRRIHAECAKRNLK
jgi:hypothetical protein